MAKRYYWLKLQQDFFSSKRIKKMRRLPGGDTLSIIYLKNNYLSCARKVMVPVSASMASTIARDSR